MPPYGGLLSDSEQNDLLNLVFSAFVGTNRHEKHAPPPLPLKSSEISSPAEGGTLYQKHCTRCHGKAGTGTGPEYLKYLPRPRNLRNSLFFASISDDRIGQSVYYGVPGTAMPAFKNDLEPDELWAIVEKVRRFSAPN
jgi:mono/diheme cytochrome c family protein